MVYIHDFKENENISGIYLVADKKTKQTKAGKDYYFLILQDKSGKVPAYVWDIGSVAVPFEKGDFITVEGVASMYNDAMQLTIRSAAKVDASAVNTADYFPVTKRDRKGMNQELVSLIASVSNPSLNRLLELFFKDDKALAKSFIKHSAAKSIHHGFIGGLLEHSLGVAKICETLYLQYPVMNRDLLITAALLHDVGKVKELSCFPENDYTDAGDLLGHVVLGAMMVSEKIQQIPEFPNVLRDELLHCILSHHGELEYGSPKKPALIEAKALAMADLTDSQMQIFAEMLEDLQEEKSDYNRFLESRILKTKMEDAT